MRYGNLKGNKMNRDYLRKTFSGPIATVPTPFDSEFRVDFARMTELTNWWIENGLVTGKSVIKVAAYSGEGAKLRENEWVHLLQTVVQASKGRATVWGAIHNLDTYQAIEYAKKAKDVGVEGLQVSPPIFSVSTQDEILKHYGALSSAVDMGILVYNNPWLTNGAIYPDTFRKMVDFECVIAIKWTNNYRDKNFNPTNDCSYEEIFDLKDKINIIDNTVQPILNHKLGGHGYIQTVAPIYPAHDLKISELMDEGNYEKANELFNSVVPRINELQAKFTSTTGNDLDQKEIMQLMGNPAGPKRPPVNPLNSNEKDELLELIKSFGWL